MTWDDVVASGMSLPGMEVSTIYGTPAFKAGGKLVTRYRDDHHSIVLLGLMQAERELLLASSTSARTSRAIRRSLRGSIRPNPNASGRSWSAVEVSIAPKRALARFQPARAAI